MSEFQYQNSTKWWCHQWLRLKLLKPRSLSGITPKASQIKFHGTRIAKSKIIHVQTPVPKLGKTKSGRKISGLQNGTIRGLHIGARGITNRGSFRDFRSRQKDCKSRQEGFQNQYRTQGTLGRVRGRNLNKNMQVGSTSGYDENNLGLTTAKISLLSRPITEYKVFTFETDFALLLPTLTGKATDLSKVSIV